MNNKSLTKGLGNFISKKVFEPYFSIHFSSEITKINVRLRELHEGSEEQNFLLYLKSIIENCSKKKVEIDCIEKRFKNLFPHQNPVLLEQLISEINKPIEYLSAIELLLNKSNDNLISALLFACMKLQGDKNYWGTSADENERNRYIANLIEAKGFTLKDQTQWSKSAEGIKSGEIDIFVLESDGPPKSIIEALNLDSLKKDYLLEHLDKLFKYDTTGLENNYILSYATAKDFIKLWEKYKAFIPNQTYIYSFIDFIEIYDYSYTDIKIGVANHIRNGKPIKLYHIMINLSER